MSSVQSSDANDKSATESSNRCNDLPTQSSNFDAALQLASNKLQQGTAGSSAGIVGYNCQCRLSTLLLLTLVCIA